MTWIFLGFVAFVALFWLAVTAGVVISMLRRPVERDWGVLAWWVVLNLLPTLVPLLS
jgi:hypothetical protein